MSDEVQDGQDVDNPEVVEPQQDATPATEEAVGTQEAPAQAEPGPVPYDRFKGVNEERNEYKALYEQAVSQNQQYQQPAQPQPQNPYAQTSQPQQPVYSEDQKWIQDSVAPLIQPMQQQLRDVLDVQQRETFWAQPNNSVVADPVKSQVEGYLAQARQTGLQVNRDDVLNYVLGQKARTDMATRVAQAPAAQQRVQQSNQVAQVSTPTAVNTEGPVDFNDMTLEEIVEWGKDIPV